MNYIKIAREIAAEAHEGQKRKYTGEDYIEHPKRVASRFSTEDSQVIAWLHDVLEDSDFTAEDLLKRGIRPHCVEIVAILTRKDYEDYFSFIMRIKDVYQARIIKIADINDNLRNLRDGSMKDKYRLAKYILETHKN